MSRAVGRKERNKDISTRGGIMRRDNLGVKSLVMLWTRIAYLRDPRFDSLVPPPSSCKTCKYFDAEAHWCSYLDEYGTQPWWGGCVAHEIEEVDYGTRRRSD